MLPVSSQDYVDILKELLIEGFTAVKFFKKFKFTYSMKTDAEDALCQALTDVSVEDNAVGNLAKSLLAIIDVHLKARRTENFWASLLIREEKDRTCRQEEIYLEKKKQKAIHVRSNVIDEHLHASTESTTEFTEFTMKVGNHDKGDTIGYHTPERHTMKVGNHGKVDTIGYHTPERHTSPEDDEEGESSLYDTFPIHIYKQPEPNPFLVSPQGTKRDRDVEEEEDDEYNADQTIIGGKSTDWIVNGVRIRESLTQYQLDKNPPKTKPEYYDVIFFNLNDKDSFLSTLNESVVEQMRSDIRRKKEKTKDNIEQDIKIFLDKIIDRDIKVTKEKLKQQKEEHITSFEKVFALEFVSHMIKLMENVNWLIEPMSEGTYIVNVLAPILSEFFTKNKQYWCASYGETCLRASARDRNSNKADNERRSNGKKIDTIISLREEDKEFSVIEVSGPPMKNDWAHFKGDRMKITKMLKTLMNQFAELNPSSDITLIRLYGLQSYLNELTIYEFQLKYAEIYTMEIILRFSLPKTWADMAKAHKTVMGLLEYERLLLESMETIKDFMWSKGGSKMTTRMINSPTESVEKTKSTATTKKTTAKKTKKARI